ncbi:hypothetical protein ZWY2020_003507 [Hordeum vulgare]|nr:hypothetical protein ZWY2020_003507 [Hordeum vulgare]
MESGSDDGSNSSSCPPGIAALRSVTGTAAGGKNKSARSRRQRVTTDLSIYSDLSCRWAPAPPRLQGVLQKDSAKELGQAWAKFFHANGIPGEKADCPHFQEAMRLTQQLGQLVQHVPTGSEIDGPCLQSEMIAARDELQSLFLEGSEDLNDFMDVVDRRVADLYDGTLMIAAGVLDPEAHYKHDLASNPDYMQAFTMAIQKEKDEGSLQPLAFCWLICHG